jgi:hypothetical protein
MKELLTKKFWRDVQKTFDDARAETTATNEDPKVVSPAEAEPELGPAAETPVPPEPNRSPE